MSIANESELLAGVFGAFISHQFRKLANRRGDNAVVDIVFKDLKLHRVVANIQSKNRRSIMLIRAFGFRKEGFCKRAHKHKDQWDDLLLYALTYEEIGFRGYRS